MHDQVLRLVDEIKADSRALTYDEAATKQAIVMRLLSILGWNPFNIGEVMPEYSLASRRVDYSLRVHGANKVFIEVKRIGEDLERHQKQLLDYSFQEGIKLAVLTNGLTWWFYLPLHEGSWEQRKFYAIDVLQQLPDDVATKFVAFLQRTNVASGQSIANAEQVYAAQKKSSVIKSNLPKAWNKILSDPNELLIELINETLEQISGIKADNSQVEAFLLKHASQFLLSEIGGATVRIGEIVKTSGPTADTSRTVEDQPISGYDVSNYAGKTLLGFEFRGSYYPVHVWKELLLTLIKVIQQSHQHEMDKSLQLAGRKRPYFSRNKDELRVPVLIEGTSIYVETNMNANQIVGISRTLVGVFGHHDIELRIDVRG